MYSNRGENPHSPRFQYAEADSLYSRITGKPEAIQSRLMGR
jgi:hypothetical protein